MINYVILAVLSIFSTGIMSYISLATPIGPWIAPTLVVFTFVLFNILNKKLLSVHNQAVIIMGASIGGILATALGFSLPTLYFLDAVLFNSWMKQPLYFSAAISGLCLTSGLFAYWIANRLEVRLIFKDQLNFPISQMIHKMISAQNQVQKAIILFAGFFSTLFFCIFQDGLFYFKSIIPKTLLLIKPLHLRFLKIPEIKFDLFPTYWAIGYITGHIIAIPLIIGAILKIFIADTINNVFFFKISNLSFMLAFCSGMVLSSVIFSLLEIPKIIINTVKSFLGLSSSNSLKLRSFVIPFPNLNNINNFIHYLKQSIVNTQWPFLLFILLFTYFFFSYFEFSLLLQFYLLIFTLICTYQIVFIAGKIGLAQLGRFATFVMVPAIFIFRLNFLQITLIATFVELVGGIATDILFGRKVAQLSDIAISKLKRYQMMGLIISSLGAGIIIWLLINNLHLGSPELFAHRAQSRALLINAVSFDKYVLFIGFIFGFILKKLNVNPMLTLGGLLMPLNISVGLIAGGLSSMILKNKEKWEPFWSGVFASHSIWMIIQAIR